MRLGGKVALLAMVAASVGCGGGAGTSERADAGPEAVCSLPPGRAFITTTAHVLPADQGLDLDGDEVVDNEIGRIPDALRAEASAGLDEAIATGQLLIAIFLVNWDPPVPTDPDVRLNAFAVVDADTPPDSSNDFGGEGRFLAPLDTLDLSCQLTVPLAEITTLVDGHLSASGPFWYFLLRTGTGALEFKNVTYVADFSEDLATAIATLGGTMTICSVSAFPFPGATSGTVLDVLANDPTIATLVSPDVDMDGDGLEQVIGDGVSILRCIDGDGTEIDGADCPCHPSIADGYSIGLEFQLVGAHIVGLI